MTSGGWLGRLGSHAIPLRVGALSAVLLGALVVSTAIMAVELTRNQRRIADATERFHRLQVAAAADRDFGQLRYWMTDLAVSLLTLSEQRAAEAEAALARDLDALEDFAPEAAQQIRAGAEAYRAAAMQAVDAYTDDNRILGNTYLAQARQGSGTVDRALSDLVAGLAAEADQANRLAAEQARASRERAVLACALIVALGAALTLLGLSLQVLKPTPAP